MTTQGREDRTLSRAFRAMGHPHRLAMVRHLLERALACCEADRVDDCRFDPASCRVGELAGLVDASPSTVSHHLKELEGAGVIERAREGRYLYCRVNEALLAELSAFLTGAGVAAEM